MDPQTRADLATLADRATPPCGDPGRAGVTTTLKCEGCAGGCGTTTRCERTHYTVPAAGGGGDVILERSHTHAFSFAFRPPGGPGRNGSFPPWSADGPTDLPDTNANLNAGALPDGRVFLASNACPHNAAPGRGRDPLVVSTSTDGWVWDTAVGVMSCELLGQCGGRYPGRAKNPGPSYPQAVTVLGGAPGAGTGGGAAAGLWVVATNNKEDVVVAKVPFAALG